VKKLKEYGNKIMSFRYPHFAGSFYPAEKKELNNVLNDLFEKSVDFDIKDKKIKGLISPHAGYIYSGVVAAAGYKILKNFNDSIKRVVILGPSHRVFITKPFGDENVEWQSLFGKIPVDKNFYLKLNISLLAKAHQFEHSLEVQIPLLQKILKNFSITPVVLNEFDDIFFENLKNNFSDDMLIVASSDLSHYLPYNEAVLHDKETINAILDLDINRFSEIGEACGSAAILTLMKLAKEMKWQVQLVDYKNSGDTTGDKEQVVGYASIIFFA